MLITTRLVVGEPRSNEDPRLRPSEGARIETPAKASLANTSTVCPGADDRHIHGKNSRAHARYVVQRLVIEEQLDVRRPALAEGRLDPGIL